MAPRQAAPSSLACMHCFKSKCKCVSRPDGDGCERCHRLKKQCRPSDSARKSANAKRRENSTARIGALEGKVDSLVRLLSVVTQSSAFSATLDNASREEDALASYDQLLSQDDQDWSSGTADTVIEGDEGVPTHRPEADTPRASMSSSYVSGTTTHMEAATSRDSNTSVMQDSETCLAVFRDKMLPSFCFTHISPNATAQQLQCDRPFLMRAIMAVASPSTQKKKKYGRELKEVLAQIMLIQNQPVGSRQSSLDLLHGLLVFTAWGYDHMHTPSSTPSRLMLLAISLACDLRLDKPLPSDEHMMKPMVDDAYEQEHNGSNHWFVAEEQRAVLACFALSSIIAIYFAQIDAMKWKPRMEESLRAIEANKGSPEDIGFAFQVRLQLLAQKAVQLREQREWDFARGGSDAGTVLSANFYIRTLQTQLHQLSDALPEVLQNRGPLKLHKYYIELCVNEIARNLFNPHQELASSSGSMNGHDVVDSIGGDLFGCDPLNCAWRSIGSIKAWMETFFSLPAAECAGLSFIHMAQLARCLMVLYRLSMLVYPGWDCNLVRNTLDILSVLEGVAKSLELASIEVGELSPDDQFTRLSAQMRKFRAKAAMRLTQNAVVEDRSWLDGEELTSPTVSDPLALQDQMGLPDAFLDNIFKDFGEGWSI